jgi:hypothetical protein
MTSAAHDHPTDTESYMVTRFAAVRHVPVTEAAHLSPRTIDAALPRVRAAYESRHEIAEVLRRQLGLDRQSINYRAAHEDAKALLRKVDELGSPIA